MAATLTEPRRPGDGASLPAQPVGGQPIRPPRPAARDDAWPHTSRWLPWMLALFMVMLWLVPFGSTVARVNLPVDGNLDRFLILGMAVCWLLAFFTGGRATPRWRPSAIDVTLLVFVAVAVLSVVVNAGALDKAGDIQLAIKQLSILFSYVFFFFFAATTLRPAEVPRFVKLLIGLALITAAGVIYQHYTGTDLFFKWAHTYLPGSIFSIREPRFAAGVRSGGTSGPTGHALAAATMLSMVVPFTLVGALQTKMMGKKALLYAATAMLVWAVFATGRKTGDYALVALLVALLAVRPRMIRRVLPVLILGLAIAIVVKPNGVSYQFRNLSPSFAVKGADSVHRKVGYPAIIPDVRNGVLIGRGYGSYDPHKYRILDNQVLALLIEVGLLGIGCFVAILISIGATAWRALRSHDPSVMQVMLAGIGATVGFATSLPLFDGLAFPQGPYMLLLIAAFVSASRSGYELPGRPGAPGRLATATPSDHPIERPERARPPRLGQPVPRRGFEGRPGTRRVRIPLRRRPAGDVPVAAPQHDPAHPPERRRGPAGELLGVARRRTAAFARTRAGRALTIIAALGLIASAFGRSGHGGVNQLLPGGGGGGGSNSPFAAVPGGPAAPGHVRSASPRNGATPAFSAAGSATSVGGHSQFVNYAPQATGAVPPATHRPSQGGNPGSHKPSSPQPPRHPRPPKRPRPTPPTTPSSPTPPTPNPLDCLPAGTPVVVEQVLQQSGVNVCPAVPASGPAARVQSIDARLRAAVAAGKLSQSKYATVITDIARAYGLQVVGVSTDASQPVGLVIAGR